MFRYAILFLFLVTFSSFVPPAQIPPHLKSKFTVNGSIPVSYAYFDNTYSKPQVHTSEIFDAYIQKALRREWGYYGETDEYLYQALDELKDQIQGKEIAIIGSAVPWYESIVLAYGAHPIVIEYNPVTTSDNRVTYLTPDQYWKNPRKFDLILSISSTEHDGLGRYGDPIDPDGDLKSMENFKKMLNPEGKLLIAFPVGPDHLVWNAHRVYGQIRLKMLFKGWRPIKYYGFLRESIIFGPASIFQPVFLLEPKK